MCEKETPLSTKLKAQSTEEGGGLFDDLAESGATSDNPQMCQESTQNGFYNPMCRSLSPFSHEPSMWGTHVIYRLWVSVSQQRPCVGLSLLYPACFQTLQSMSFVRSSDPEASVADHSFLLSPSSLGGGSYTGRLAGVQGFPFLCIWTKLI